MRNVPIFFVLATLPLACSGRIPDVPLQTKAALSQAARVIIPPAPLATIPPEPLPALTVQPVIIPPSPTATTAAPTPTPTPARMTGESAPSLRPLEDQAARRGLAAITIAISLPSLTDFSTLDRRPELGEALALARRHPKAPIFLAAYVTEADVREREADPKMLSELLIVELGRQIAKRGIAPERISGEGMGINPAIGRAVIFSLDIAPAR